MKLKLEIKQIENVLLIKVPEDVDFMKLDKKALDETRIYFGRYTELIATKIVKSYINISNIRIIDYNTYQSYEFETEQQATEKREELEKSVTLYNESLEGKCSFERGRVYWFIDSVGYISSIKWIAHKLDIFRFQNGNVFKSEEECQRKLDIINFVNENKYEFTKEEWENRNVVKWYLFAYTEDKRLIVDCYRDIKFHNTPYFKDQETAQKVADFIGYDDFMKYC